MAEIGERLVVVVPTGIQPDRELVGIIASIIGVAGAGFRLSLILNAVGCEVASAGIEIHSIAKSVSLFALMLKQVGQTLKESDSIHSAEAVDTAREIKDQCQLVFDEISEMLDKVQKKDGDGNLRGPSLAQKFKWCFKKQRVTYLLAQLESLKLSLIVMMQILHLGKLMTPSPIPDPREGPELKKDLIAQERAEVQNMVVVRYWSVNRLDRLYNMAEREAEDDDNEKRIEASPVDNRHMALEAPPDYNSSRALIKLPVVSLGELDASMNAIKESPREMLRVSGEVINPLLSKWTRLEEIQEQAKRGFVHGNGTYPSRNAYAYEYYETDEEESPPSPEDVRAKGFYLEGPTTDWRNPHSADARRERLRLRKHYQSFQPSVDSDAEDREASKHRKKRPSSRHIIDSSDESEPDGNPRRRRSSEGSKLERAKTTDNTDKRPRSYTPDTRAFSDKFTTSPRPSMSSPSPYANARPPLQQVHQQRPMVNPSQIPNFHHSVSSPILPHGQPPSPNRSPYGSPYVSSTFPPPPPYNSSNFRHQYAPGHLQPQPMQSPRPGPLIMPRAGDVPQPRPSSRHSSSSKSPRDSRESYAEKEKRQNQRERDLKSGATKGILGGLGIASFLELLEGLSI